MPHAISSQFPIWFDFGFMVSPAVLLGAYVQYGFVQLKAASAENGACPQGADCSAHDARVGLQIQYHFGAQRRFDPWIGYGVNYEILSLSMMQNGSTSTASLLGWEFANLQAGAEFAITPGFSLGPFASFALGQYLNYDLESAVTNADVSIPNRTLHEWLLVGVRGSLGI